MNTVDPVKIKAQYAKRMSEDGKQLMATYQSNKRQIDRRRVLLMYSGYVPKCKCCGETYAPFLTVDHINGNGNKHRSETNRRVVQWIIKNKYPTGFQILCMNCNWAKYKCGLGHCPCNKLK